VTWLKLKRNIGFVWAFVLGAIGIGLIWFREILLPQMNEHEAAKKTVDDAKATVDTAKADAAASQAELETAKAAAEERLAWIDEQLAAERKRDSVDVANDIIRGP
jgi:hypothetical protein